MIYLKTGHPISGMTLHVCTPPPDKVATPAVVAPVVAGRGECIPSRVVHPSGFKGRDDQSRNAAWAAVTDRPCFQFSKNCVTVLCRDALHLGSKGFKKPQYIFGIDGLSLRWLAIGWGCFGHQFHPSSGR